MPSCAPLGKRNKLNKHSLGSKKAVQTKKGVWNESFQIDSCELNFAFKRFQMKTGVLGSVGCTEVAFALLTQLPWVWITV